MSHRQPLSRRRKGRACREFGGLLGPLLVVIGGCSTDNLADLERYVQEVKSRPKGAIEPIPEAKLSKYFTYQAGELRSPFAPTVVELPSDLAMEGDNSAKSKVKPDRKRLREALEEHALDSLKMVGILEQGEEIWAIIRTSDGMLYRVKKGNYMGRHDGKITHIDERRIELIELIGDEQGGWLERPATLALTE
jgi:type IV pilus assembly protein PilP